VTGPLQLFTNNAISILDQNLSPTGTVIHLAQNYGPLFPVPQNPGEFFLVTLETTTAPFHREIVKIDQRVGDDLHVAAGGRAQEGTTAQAWTAGLTIVDHRITAETIRQAFLQPVSSGGTGDAGPPLLNPVFSYNTDGTLAEIAYEGGAMKAFAYEAGLLASVTEHAADGTVTTKVFHYTDGVLTSIAQAIA